MVEAPLHRGLPDEIVVWEILVRLPPKTLLRCRAVCPAWRRGTSTHGFLLAHHARQPSSPLLYTVDRVGVESIHIVSFGHRAGVAAAGDQFQSVARLGNPLSADFGSSLAAGDFGLQASCDGLLVLGDPNRELGFSVCNPATRQHAPLPQLDGFALVVGMYPHSPTGEYRLLLVKATTASSTDGQDGVYVFSIGSGQPPRRIGRPGDTEEILVLMYGSPAVLYRGSLHRHIPQADPARDMILAFDSVAETFRRMRPPAVPGCCTDLFVMGDMLAMSSFQDAGTVIDIWVMRDYEGQVWTFKHRVELPFAELTAHCGKFFTQRSVVVPSWDAHVFVLVQIDDWLFHVDTDGKLVASFHGRGLSPTQLWLKQTLVPHNFFLTLEGYVVNASPFI